MSNQIVFYLVLIPVLIAGFYLLIPLLILNQQKLDANPKFKELNFDTLDAKTSKFLIKRTEALIKLGFAEPILLQIENPAPNVNAYLTMLVNRAAGDKAMVNVVMSTGEKPQQTSYVEFSTRFDSGEMFNTMNSEQLSGFRPGVQTIRTQTPSVADPAELYELHKFVMAKHAPSGRKTMFEPGKAIEFLKKSALIESYDEQVRMGFLKYDAAAEAYRPTVKGAYLMTWGLLPPFKGMRMAAMKRKEERILKEFEQAGK